MKSHARYVVTLVAAPGSAALSDALLARAKQALEDRVGASARLRVLDPGAACDLTFEAPGIEPDTRLYLRGLADQTRAAFDHEPVDVVAQPDRSTRRKKLLLADMDSTVIQQECVDELADFVGLRQEVAAITDRAMRGEIEFAPALRARVRLLEGLPESVIERTIAEKITLTPGGRTLVATMRAHGAHTSLISGGFTAFTSRIAQAVGFDESRANVLIVEDGRLAGRVAEPILGREAKRAALIELREGLGLRPEETLAVGDGANDLDMLVEAGLGVAFRAKPSVAAAAQARVDRSDLTALLYLQGYGREDLVEA